MNSARTRSVLAIHALCLSIGASAQLVDDFNDNDYTNGPVWSSTNALFVAVGGQLRSNSPGAANYYLSTPSTQATSAQWDYYINLKFATSGANYADVYLMSSAADLQSGVNGYFVRFGGTADRVELFRSDAGTATSMVASPDGIVNSSSDNPFNIRVTRDAGNNWTLLYDDGATGTYSTAGTVVDAAHSTSTHFGIRIEQSTAASAVNNHFLDNVVVGPIVLDVTPPSVVSVTALSSTQVDVLFNEPLNAAAIGTYDIIPFIGVSAQVLDGGDPALVHVTPSLPLTSGNSYQLIASGAQDLSGNAAVSSTTDFLYFVPDVALPGDVIINEIMADPSPVVGLPDAEFVEIHNTTTNKTFDLADWTITDGSTIGTLPSIALPPGGYVILTDDANAAAFQSFGTVASITTFPSLNNDGDALSLSNNNATVIDAVTYALSWYNNSVKAAGGWTLERIDPTTPCSTAANWTASNAAQGGTPGQQNSVFAIVPDVTAPALVNAFVNSDTQVELQFSETMNAASLAGASYAFDPPLSIDLASVSGDALVQLTLAAPLVVGQLYTITVTGATDCVGNAIGAANMITIALPEPVLPGDVVLNEVLYDPRGYGSDFVELYNRSTKVLSLANWKLANETNGVIGNATVITSAAYLLLPGQYVLIAEDTANIADAYPLGHRDRFLQADMPSYNNGAGVVVLQDILGDTLDRFAYDDALHFELLNSVDGVSLERVDPERPATDPTNWHSAAETVGYATPGYLNSQYSPTVAARGELSIEPAIFSPDNDGYQDLLTLAYRFDQPGFTGTLKIYDVAGREVVTLLDNELLGTNGAVSWNGIMEGGDLARMGPYVAVFEAFDLSGNVERFRKTAVLAHKL
jgi:hypothetical protein